MINYVYRITADDSPNFLNFRTFSTLSKSKLAFIVAVSLACLAIAYSAYRWIKFKAKNASTVAHPFPQASSAHSENKLKEEVIKSSQNNLMDSATDLRKGYAVIPFLPHEEIDQRFVEIKDFDSLPEEDKKQFSQPEVEFGYAALKGKKVFVIRNQQVPEELRNFIPHFKTVHAISLKILADVEKSLALEEGILTKTVSKNPLPEIGKATSLLRLFAYDPSSEEGHAADAHEDLGLLTIIPRSHVPALEVMDLHENGQWIDLEGSSNPSQAVVLAGATLEKLTQGKILAAPHRVKKSALKRFSIVFQLRAEPQTKIHHQNQEMTVEEWLSKLKANLTSVNGSY